MNYAKAKDYKNPRRRLCIGFDAAQVRHIFMFTVLRIGLRLYAPMSRMFMTVLPV